MKRIFLSTALLLCFCTLAIAQRKIQFGVNVQTGTYQPGQQEHYANEYLTSDYQLGKGLLVGLGVYAEKTLGHHLALYSGLNFSQSTFNERFTTVYPSQERISIGTGTNKQTYSFIVRQVSLPIQLQLQAGTKHQVAFSIGAAPSFTVSKLRFDPDNQSGFSPYVAFCDVGFDNSYYADTPSSKFQVLFIAGLHYRPDAINTLSLEYWQAPKVKESDSSFASLYGYTLHNYEEPRQMRSVQVSLRHSW